MDNIRWICLCVFHWHHYYLIFRQCLLEEIIGILATAVHYRLRIKHSTAIGDAARALHETRQSALDGDPKLALTALYNKRPTWLQHRHEDLDRAVLDAYGWPEDLADEELLERLLALNLERAELERQGTIIRPL